MAAHRYVSRAWLCLLFFHPPPSLLPFLFVLSIVGILGPAIECEEGDNVLVMLKNFASRPYSIHAHGMLYDSQSEGVGFPGVAPGAAYVYNWTATYRSAPGPSDPSSIVWLYHSHVHSSQDINTGLVGVIVVTKQGRTKSAYDSSPGDVEREFVLFYTIFNENVSYYIDDNIGMYIYNNSNSSSTNSNINVDKGSHEWQESNKMHTINGLMFGNVHGLQMGAGDRVRWYVAALGDEVDVHVPRWHGHTVVNHGHRTDSVELLPAVMLTVDMVAGTKAKERESNLHFSLQKRLRLVAIFCVNFSSLFSIAFVEFTLFFYFFFFVPLFFFFSSKSWQLVYSLWRP